MPGSSFYQAAVGAGPIHLGTGPHRFVLPHLPADAWILALSDVDPVACVIPGMLDEPSEERLYRLVESGRMSLDGLRDLAFQAVSEASGRKWWIAMKIVGMAGSDDGEFFGRLLLKGIDPGRLTFGAWCAAAYALALSGQESKDRLRFTSKLMAPPAGFEEQADEGMDFSSMVKMARAMPGMSVG